MCEACLTPWELQWVWVFFEEGRIRGCMNPYDKWTR